jgi:hypothetical protein
MIKAEPCKGCGRILFTEKAAGLTTRCETVPLEADGAVQALVGGKKLHRVMFLSGRPSVFSAASPAVLGKLRTEPGERPYVVEEHRCTVEAARARLAAEQSAVGSGAPVVPPKASAAPSRPSSALSGPDPVASAETQGSDDGPRCDDCGLIMGQGDYVSVQIGEVIVWASHVANCGGNP